jgi:hypothetical protein
MTYSPSNPQPPNWAGKKLIRLGNNPPLSAMWSSQQYLLESNIPQPYIIVGTGQATGDYIPTRLTIYVNANDIVENVIYG